MNVNKKDVDLERKYIEILNSQCSNLIKERDSKLEQLKQDLQSGKIKSNHPLKDFVTVCFGSWNIETTKPYWRLTNQIQENIGNEILIIKQEFQEHDDIMYLDSSSEETKNFMPPMKTYEKKLGLTFGKLSGGLEFNIQTGDLIFPTKKHVKTNTKFTDFGQDLLGSVEWDLVEDSIKEKFSDLPHLYEELARKSSMYYFGILASSAGRPTSKILFGKNVEDYFNKCAFGQEVYASAKKLIE